MNPKRAAVLIGVASLSALTSACSVVPHRPPPVRYDLAPAYYYYSPPQRPYQPPQTYTANTSNRVPVAPPPPPSWQDQAAPYAAGAAAGAVGGAVAGRAMGASGTGGQAAKGALPGQAHAIAKPMEPAPPRAAPSAAARAGTTGTSGALTAGRTAGAAGAGAAAAGAAETAGGGALIGRAVMWTFRKSWLGLLLLPAGEFLLSEGKPDDR